MYSEEVKTSFYGENFEKFKCMATNLKLEKGIWSDWEEANRKP